MSFTEFCLSPDLAGSAIISSAVNYNKFFTGKAADNALWHVAHVITGIVVYPLAAVASLFGLLLNACSYVRLRDENRRIVNQRCSNMKLAIGNKSKGGDALRDIEAGVVLFLPKKDSRESEYLRISYGATVLEQTKFFQKIRDLIEQDYTRHFVSSKLRREEQYGNDYHYAVKHFEKNGYQLETDINDSVWCAITTRIIEITENGVTKVSCFRY